MQPFFLETTCLGLIISFTTSKALKKKKNLHYTDEEIVTKTGYVAKHDSTWMIQSLNSDLLNSELLLPTIML